MEKGARPRAAAVLRRDTVPLSRSLASTLSPSRPLRLTACLQPSRSQQSPRSRAIYQVETWGGLEGLEQPQRRQHGCLLAPSATRRRGTTSPGPWVPLGVRLGTALCIPNPLTLCPARSCPPGARPPRLPGGMLLAALTGEL